MPDPNYLQFFPNADQNGIKTLSDHHQKRLAQNKKGFIRFRQPYDSIKHLRAKFLDFSTDQVIIGRQDELSSEDLNSVKQAMKSFMPWRKGPFNIFDTVIDAEWRSERKWNRLAPHLPDLTDKVIADIGCNNGYYMFKMAHHKPRFVLGFEPYIQHYFAFKTLNSLACQDNLLVEPFGVEDVPLFPASFDVVFLMGIIYHRISPIEMLKELKASIRPGGCLIIESQAIPGDMPVALFPEKTYAKVPGTYFVPTPKCLENWLLRAGFKNIQELAFHPMSSKEQRRTDWMTFESYSDFIDQENPELTIEGYPAPYRIYLKASS